VVCWLQCRIIIYKKGLDDKIDIVSPAVVGGLKGETYLALNPQGKMPLLTIPGSDPIPESEVLIHPKTQHPFVFSLHHHTQTDAVNAHDLKGYDWRTGDKLLVCNRVQVISQYLLDKYSDLEPSFLLASPEGRARVASITRVLDIYIHSIQVGRRLLCQCATV